MSTFVKTDYFEITSINCGKVSTEKLHEFFYRGNKQYVIQCNIYSIMKYNNWFILKYDLCHILMDGELSTFDEHHWTIIWINEILDIYLS